MDNPKQNAAIQEGNVLHGFFIMLASFFSMPIKTLKITFKELKEVSSKGKLEIEATSSPHLTWLQVAGHFLISVAIVIILAIGIYMGLDSFLQNIRYSFKSAVGGLVLYPLLGALYAILMDWSMAIWYEFIGLLVNIANDIKKMSQR